MLGEEKIHEITAKVLSLSQADQTEVLVFSDDSQLTRFATLTSTRTWPSAMSMCGCELWWARGSGWHLPTI